MHVIHSHNGRKADEHIKKEAALFCSNKKGNFISIGGPNFSHTQGLFFFDAGRWSPYKAIDEIHVDDELVSLRNNFSSIERVYKRGAEESFNLFNNSLVYSIRKHDGSVTLDLDFRHMFDYDDRGRIYSIAREGDCIVVRYDKYSDHSLSRLECTRFLAIRGLPDYCFIGQWLKKKYAYDERRSARSEFYVYRALSFKVAGSMELVMSFSEDKAKALEHANSIFINRHYYINSMKKYVSHAFQDEDLAVCAAEKALDDLLVTIEGKERKVGVFAGYPWFFQFWSRDELISLKAFILQEKFDLVKAILFRYLESIAQDGLVPNRLPESAVKSLDAVGWLFLRANEFIHSMVQKKVLDKFLSLAELIRLKQALEHSIQGLAHNHTEGGLVKGSMQESWMDTKKAGREGAFIEVQALFLAMLKMHNDLAKMTKSKPLFRGIEKEYRDAVRAAFYKGGILLDTYPDQGAIRPNIFLAYYIYPDLLSKPEWKLAFDITLKELWLDWGGLMTLNHKSPLFRQEYTGEDDASYHNGDSWFYVNNYAAIALARIDREYYSKKIERIRHASKEELLFSGYVGCAAELSSAKALRSEGCLSQAWSAASFIEMMIEIKSA